MLMGMCAITLGKISYLNNLEVEKVLKYLS